jgi:hypothetical protein
MHGATLKNTILPKTFIPQDNVFLVEKCSATLNYLTDRLIVYPLFTDSSKNDARAKMAEERKRKEQAYS